MMTDESVKQESVVYYVISTNIYNFSVKNYLAYKPDSVFQLLEMVIIYLG